ncbi:MAG TPA: GldG family protein, partial [Polyangiaceae bacterium]|nr:GldG family protein [Polyangiaceae bacterium]
MTAREAQKGRAVGQLTGSLASLFLVAIILMVNYLAYRHYQRFDWTSQSLFTLSEKSKQVLRKLDNDVDIYVFMSRNEPSAQQTDELLKRYGAVTQHLRVHHVDPDRQAAEFKLLAQRFGVASGEIESGTAIADVAAVVAFGAKNWHIKREDLSALDMGPAEGEGGGTEQVSVKIEQSFTGAIVQVTSGRPTHVCVTAGHGEWTLEEAGDRSLSSFKATLRHDNIEWQGFETLGKTSVPKECDAVFVLGPLRAFSSAESKLLFDYLRAGGNLWLALDPVIELDQVVPSGFEDPLRDLGVRLDRALVLELDQDHLLSPNASEFIVT